MPFFLLAVLTFIGSALVGAVTGPNGSPFLSTPSFRREAAVCLDEETARNGIGAADGVVNSLPQIKKPVKDDFISGMGYEYPRCTSGDCDYKTIDGKTVDNAEYVLVASHVKVNPVIFDNSFRRIDPRLPKFPSDRQFLRYRTDASISTDAATQEYVRGRVFRTFCGDWCVLNLTYRGSMYCDFLFYLEDVDEDGKPQIDDAKTILQPVDYPDYHDANLPRNGSLMSVYFRKDAPIPKLVACKTTPTPQAGVNFLQKVAPRAFAQNGNNAISWPPNSAENWLYKMDGMVKNTEVNGAVKPFPAQGQNEATYPVSTGEQYEVFKNLQYPSSDDIVYLVPKGEYDRAMAPIKAYPTVDPANPTPGPDPEIIIIHYKEFHRITEVKPKDSRSLQLGTIQPIRAADWIKQWYQESKPAIYFYPERDMVLSVALNPAGRLTVSDPHYPGAGGWQNVHIHPNGYLTYEGKEYPYLYYEAALDTFPIPEQGTIVPGNQLVSYFKDVLPQLGLQGREIDEFIEYWMTRLNAQQPYYFIHFLDTKTIERIEPLTLSHQPDVSIRIRPYFKPLLVKTFVQPQTLEKPATRRGFTLVEWGGILDE